MPPIRRLNCTDHGGNLFEVHTTTFSDSSGATLTSSKNGQLRVPAESASAVSAPQVCPNPNWTPSIAPGTLVLATFGVISLPAWPPAMCQRGV